MRKNSKTLVILIVSMFVLISIVTLIALANQAVQKDDGIVKEMSALESCTENFYSNSEYIGKWQYTGEQNISETSIEFRIDARFRLNGWAYEGYASEGEYSFDFEDNSLRLVFDEFDKTWDEFFKGGLYNSFNNVKSVDKDSRTIELYIGYFSNPLDQEQLCDFTRYYINFFGLYFYPIS